MYRVLACLANEHDYWLVGLAAVVCIATALTSFRMYSIACASQGGRRVALAIITGVCTGSGIWATHFVAMLAYRGGLPTYYEPVATLASLLVAIGVAACGFALAARGDRWSVGFGGAVVGIAIGVMHYAGMHAPLIPGNLSWDESLIIASLVIGVVFSAAAMLAFHHKTGIAAIAFASGLLTLAICGLHFTAMGAVTVQPDPTVAFQGFGINRAELALAVAAVTSIVLLTALAAAAVQQTNLRCEAVLREQNSLFEVALHHLPVGLSMFDSEQRLIMCNPAYRRLYGLADNLSCKGASFSDIVFDYVRRGGSDDATHIDNSGNWIAEHLSKVGLGKVFTETVRLTDGRSIFKKVSPIAGGGWVDLQEDITAVQQSGEKIEWLARHDPLTAIANRFQFRERLEHQFECYDPRLGFALHWIDLDHFKEINDQYGHQVGDGYLKSVANRLATSLRAGDLVGRLGGDEFAILQVGGGRKDLAEQFAARILKNISQPHDVLGHKLDAGASIGIALAPQHGQDPDHLFASADAALYYAKLNGRGAAVVYEPACAEAASPPNPLKGELPRLVQRDELVLHYQPIVDLREKRVSGFEALMRWKHPSRGMIPPSEFIGLAEVTGDIVSMGSWALKQACMDAKSWPETIKVSVNLSAVQIEKGDLYEVVIDALTAASFEPQRLQLEITESVLMHDSVRTQATLRKLNNLGVTVALDDFGTCFATLNYLRSFPFKKVKIDRSFVHDVTEHHDRLVIVRSLADLASELNIKSVAEGVETAAELTAVSFAGYDEAQGFYFSLPVPARAVKRTIAQCAARFEIRKTCDANKTAA